MPAHDLSDEQWCLMDLLVRSRQRGIDRLNRLEVLATNELPKGVALKLIFGALTMPVVITTREHRRPPLPGLSRIFGGHKRIPSNHCPVCGHECFEGGDWRESAGRPRWNKSWHDCCLAAHNTWTRYADLAFRLAVKQGGRCPISRERILSQCGTYHLPGVQVDHIVPLWRIAVDAHLYQWPDVLRFWGLGNLQALSASGHRAKNAKEAKERASLARVAVMAGQPALEI